MAEEESKYVIDGKILLRTSILIWVLDLQHYIPLIELTTMDTMNPIIADGLP
jgi:hypothetical protein